MILNYGIRQNVKAAFPRRERREARKNLKTALALFGPNGEKWIKRSEKRKQYDGSYAYCAIGAVKQADGPGEQAALSVLGVVMSTARKPTKNSSKSQSRIFTKNDSGLTTFADVRRYFQKAIAYLAD